MVVCPHDVTHAADVRVVQQADNGRLSRSADFLGVVCSLTVGLTVVLVGRLPRNNLDGNLLARSRTLCELDLPHTACADGLTKGPCSCAGCCDGGPPPRGRGLAGPRPLCIGSYAIDRHVGLVRRV